MDLYAQQNLMGFLGNVQVFEPVIEINMKVSAEEIETALITPNSLLAQLHIALLKVLVSSLFVNCYLFDFFN